MEPGSMKRRQASGTQRMEPACATVLFLILTLVVHHGVLSEFTNEPSDSEHLVNETTYFNCSSSITSKEIHWFHYPVGVEAHERKSVYAFNKFYKDYEEDFVLDINLLSGTYNLVIRSVKQIYAGKYECQEDGGSGNGAFAELIVLVDEPTCLSNFIRDGDICGIDPNKMQLSCSVGYHGNIPPQLEWRKAGENSPIGNAISIPSGSNTTHSVTLKTDLSMDGLSYVCQKTRSTTSQYKCSSETIRLQYAFGGDERVNATMDKEVKCSANSSQPCGYKWISESDSKTVTTDQSLKPTRLGSHRCEATCDVGNTSCTVNVMFVEVLPAAIAEGSETTDGNSSVSVGVVVGVVLSLLLPVVVVIVIVVICLYIRRRRNSKQKGDFETIKLEQSTTPLVAFTAEDDKQVKKSDPEPNKGNPITDDNPIIIPDDEKVGNEYEKPDGIGANKADLPLTALNAEAEKKIKPSDAKRNKVLSHLEGKPEFVSTVDRGSYKNKSITGVAVLNNNLFVAAEDSSVLEVYDVTNKCALLRRVLIPNMVNPYDLSSCHIIECVFIIDSKFNIKPKEIIRLESTEAVGKRWSTGDDFGNISVTSESNIIFCVTDKNKLIEYTKDGDKIREIALPDKVLPQHAIKLINGNFVISHGKRYGLLHQVCIVNTNGEAVKLVKFFGKEHGDSLQQLHEPRYLIVDKEGSVLVVDKMNNRLLLLDSDLNAKRDFLKEYLGVKNPDKMCLCEATRNLFVVNSTNTVLIFSIK